MDGHFLYNLFFFFFFLYPCCIQQIQTNMQRGYCSIWSVYFVWIKHSFIAYTFLHMDPSNSVKKRLWDNYTEVNIVLLLSLFANNNKEYHDKTKNNTCKPNVG